MAMHRWRLAMGLAVLFGGLGGTGQTVQAAELDGFQIEWIQGFDDLSLNDRLGTSSGSEDHVINIEDCEAYLGGQIEVGWSYTIPSGAQDRFTAKLAPVDSTCSTGDWEANDCTIVADDLDATADSERPITLDMADILGSQCAVGSNYTVRLYIVLHDEVDDTYYSAQVNFEVDLQRPDPPTIDEVTSGEGGLRVSMKDDSSDSEDHRYKVYWSDQEFSDPTEGGVSSSGTFSNLTYKITGLQDGTWYYVRATTFDKNDNESLLSVAATGQPQPVTDFFEAYKQAGGDEQGGFCFIATAAYGSVLHPYVSTLRRFRDRYLMQTDLGRRFVQWYYQNSPPAAQFIRQHPVIRFLTQLLLLPLVLVAWFLIDLSLWAQIACLLTFYVAFCWVRRGSQGNARKTPLPALPTGGSR